MLENSGFQFWREKLGSPRFVVAPMVDQSELAWRMFSRKYGAQLCYTPMLHASVFLKDLRYRKENFVSCSEDKPLIVQFCANDPDVFVEACKLVVNHCDAVDLNLGCPQAIAKRGRYGAFLQDEWDLLKQMVSRASKEVGVPITCKIRVFPDIDRTVKYAQMLEDAGCQLLTVHGRTREQKGPSTGLASWDHIKAVKSKVSIPVFANGNIQHLADVHKCLEETGVDGVMIAEGSLHNPALFQGLIPTVWSMALEYLDFVEKYPCPTSYIRGHLFKLCHHCLAIEENKEIRQQFAVGNTIEDFRSATLALKDKYEFIESDESSQDYSMKNNLSFSPWICQPYIRPPPGTCTDEKCDESENFDKTQEKRPISEKVLSRKKLRKLQKRINFKQKQTLPVCKKCANPKGTKCSFDLCKSCCRTKTRNEILDCLGHRFAYKTKKKNHIETQTESDVQTSCDTKVYTIHENYL